MSDEIELKLIRLGAQGDGVAVTPSGPVFVPFALPGDRIRARVDGDRGKLTAILESSLDRVEPICRHFGTCGGCALQHMSSAAYLRWKRDLVVSAFAARGLSPPISDVISAGGKRRRAIFSLGRIERDVVLGFHEGHSHTLVDIDECPVLHSSIATSLPALRKLCEPLVSRGGEPRLTVTATNAGLDVVLSETARALTPVVRAGIAQAAAAGRLARFSIDDDTVYAALPPTVTFGSVDVVLPPGAFLQALASAEAAIAALLTTAVGKAESVADLFSGSGAFTFRLAEQARVFAADGNPAAINALTTAAKAARRIKPVTAIVRDLFREPLSALELRDFDAVVFDPPRAGAEAQARMVAKSKVATVVAISCAPATLARDARILVDGGYNLESVTPIDQFSYTPHVETLAIFRR